MQMELQNLSMTYPSGKQALYQINLALKAPSLIGLLGPNGAGKSTLMKLLVAALVPTQGRILIDGRPLEQEERQLKARLGYLPQDFGLFDELTVAQFLDYMAALKGLRNAGAAVQKAIQSVNLAEKANARIRTLSGGQRQRVGIARAYCNDPKVMLMDEPFGHLDAQTRYMMEEELEKIWQKEKRTVVFVTNNIEEAVYLADRIILLTNCPTTIKKEYVVDLPRPRSYVDQEFLRLRKEILDNTDETL